MLKTIGIGAAIAACAALSVPSSWLPRVRLRRSGSLTHEIGGVDRAALACVGGDLGIRAERTAHVDLAVSDVRGHDLIGRDLLLAPLLEQMQRGKQGR